LDEDQLALASYEKALQFCQDGPANDVYNALGLHAMKKSDHRAAMKHFLRAVEAKPDDVTAMMHISSALVKQGKSQDALKWSEEAIKAAPNMALTRVYLAHLRAKMKNFTEAEEQFQKAITIDKSNTIAYQKYGDLKMDIGDHEKAMELYQKAIDADPSDIDNYIKIGHASMMTNTDAEAAFKWFKAASTIDPNHPAPYNSVGIVLSGLNRDEEALPYFHKAVELNPEDATEALLNIATIYNTLGQYDKAIDLLQKANPKPGQDKQLIDAMVKYLKETKAQEYEKKQQLLDVIPDNANSVPLPTNQTKHPSST